MPTGTGELNQFANNSYVYRDNDFPDVVSVRWPSSFSVLRWSTRNYL